MSRLRTIVVLLIVVVAGCASVVSVGSRVLPKPKPVPVSVRVVDWSGATVADAEATVNGLPASGAVGVLPNDFPVQVTASASGYHPASTSVLEPPDHPVEILLRPIVARGTVTTASGVPLAGATVELGDVGGTTGADGSFELAPAIPGDLVVTKPAWEPVTALWENEADTPDIQMEPRIVKAIHAVMWLPGRDSWQSFLDLASRTEINAIVLDVKDESGLIAHASQVPLAIGAGAVSGSYVLADAVADIHNRDLYAIGRVVAFEDPVMAVANPDLAILRGSKPYRQGSQAFLDPTDPQARAYNIALAVEACKAGLDEIQFDYVRFPTGLTATMTLDGGGVYVGSEGQQDRVDTIATFLQEAGEALHPLGCAVSADVFAIVLSTDNDQGIGQRPEEIGAAVDALSPMIYPDHYSDGWIGFAKPADHPGAVVDNALASGMPRLPADTIMRPWIADFNYGAGSVRAEIDAAESYGLGWMLWNAGSRVTEGALQPAPEG